MYKHSTNPQLGHDKGDQKNHADQMIAEVYNQDQNFQTQSDQYLQQFADPIDDSVVWADQLDQKNWRDHQNDTAF